MSICDITQLKEGDLMRDFLKGVINAFQTSIKGVDVAGIDKTLEEIAVKFLPNAEMKAELMAQEGYSENEHYHMGEVWGYLLEKYSFPKELPLSIK